MKIPCDACIRVDTMEIEEHNGLRKSEHYE